MPVLLGQYCLVCVLLSNGQGHGLGDCRGDGGTEESSPSTLNSAEFDSSSDSEREQGVDIVLPNGFTLRANNHTPLMLRRAHVRPAMEVAAPAQATEVEAVGAVVVVATTPPAATAPPARAPPPAPPSPAAPPAQATEVEAVGAVVVVATTPPAAQATEVVGAAAAAAPEMEVVVVGSSSDDEVAAERSQVGELSRGVAALKEQMSAQKAAMEAQQAAMEVHRASVETCVQRILDAMGQSS